MKSYTQKAVAGISILFVMYAFSLIFSFAFRVLLARELTVAEYGLYYALFSFFSMIFLFRDLGMQSALVKFLPEWLVKKEHGEIKQAVLLSAVYSIIISLLIISVCFIFRNYLANHFFKNPETGFFIILFSIAFSISTFESLISAIYQSYQRMLPFTLITIFKSGFLLLFTFIFLKFSKTILAPSYALLVSSLIIVIFWLPTIFKLIFWKTALIWNNVSAKRFVLFGAQIFFTGLGGSILINTDILMLTYFKTVSDVGLYNTAVPIANLLLYLGSAIGIVMFPMFAELIARKMQSKIEEALRLLYKYIVALALPFVAIVFTFPDFIIRICFGSDYIGASIALQVLIWSVFLGMIGGINYNYYNASGKPLIVTKIFLLGALLNLILNFIFIPKFGITGAAITTAMCSGLMLIYNSWQLHKYLHIHAPWFQWFKNVLCCIAMILIIFLLKSIINLPIYFEAAIVLLISGSIYLLLLYIFKIIDIKEIRDLIKRTVHENPNVVSD